jgi:hypothetical protein
VKHICGHIRRTVLGLSSDETTCAKRGFRVAEPAMRKRFEEIGRAFLAGYQAALQMGGPKGLAAMLDSVELEQRGFAYEGAAMALALLDSLSPRSPKRVRKFLSDAGEPHAYMVHVGAGWVWARVPWAARRLRPILEPLLQWLAFDGWGFHEGFFRWHHYIAGQPPPNRLRGYEQRAFNQGLGRSWWFVNGGSPELIVQVVSRFPSHTQGDMWSGVGLAATYAGVVNEAVLEALSACCREFRPQLAQGAAFAAKARQRAGNLTEYTELAARVLCGLSAREAARLCDATLENLPADAPEQPAYETWRHRIQAQFMPRTAEMIA